jgi:osmotically-inducible protein OsmY
MNTVLAKHLGAALLLVGFLSACATNTLPANYAKSSDAQITTEVLSRIRQHADVWPQTAVYVSDGVVHLSGIEPTELAKADAEEYLQGLNGVKLVIDNTSVDE